MTPFPDEYEVYSVEWCNHLALLESLLRVLNEASEGKSTEVAMDTFRSNFLAFGSNTSGNVRAIQGVEFSFSKNDAVPAVGLRFIRSGVLVSDLIYDLENMAPPKGKGSLARADWEDAMRFIGNLLRAMQLPLIRRTGAAG